MCSFTNFHKGTHSDPEKIITSIPGFHAIPSHSHPPEVTSAQPSKRETVLCGSGLLHSILCLRDFSTLCAIDSFHCCIIFHTAFTHSTVDMTLKLLLSLIGTSILMMKCLALFLKSCCRIISSMESQVHTICDLPFCMPAAHSTYS